MLKMKKTILYVGGFRFPSHNASAQRARENAKLFKSLGYDVILMGKIEPSVVNESVVGMNSCEIDGFICYDIRHPDYLKQYPSYVSRIDTIQSVIEKLGVESIYAIIAYNYPPKAMRSLIRYAKKYKIKIIAECTEWHGWEGKKIIRNLLRYFQTEYRMRVLARRARNIICANQDACDYYSDCHTLALPFVIDTNDSKWKIQTGSFGGKRRQFIYAGSPGMGMSKDYLHYVVEAFANVKQLGYEFEFKIVGITLQQLLEAFPNIENKIYILGNSIQFLGRLPHHKTILEICQSDFFVFLRPNNRVSRFGFPTKLAEAFSCGVPTITNKTSDIGLYLLNGNNGFLLQHPDIQELYYAIIQALSISENRLLRMKNACRNNNPFHFENFREKVGAFLQSVR
jgi:glycosyltransferase involved in cell wall biosynthesis